MIKRINQSLAAAALCVALAAPAFAEGEMPDSEHGRYSFSKVAEGFLRLDMQTGQVSVCTQRAVGWACQATPDDRAVLENEIARLRTENAGLKKEMLAHGLALPGSGATAPESSGTHDHHPSAGQFRNRPHGDLCGAAVAPFRRGDRASAKASAEQQELRQNPAQIGSALYSPLVPAPDQVGGKLRRDLAVLHPQLDSRLPGNERKIGSV